jgi:tripartite-type tricarboxylate transporter receptor subunit TctC
MVPKGLLTIKRLLLPAAKANAINATLYKADEIRAIAVTIGVRAPSHLDIPTIDEFEPDFEASQWYRLAAPRNRPSGIVEVLNKETNAGLADQKAKDAAATLVSRFRSSHDCAARSFANFEIEGH